MSSPAPESKRKPPTREQLAVMQIRRVIFHDVPRRIKAQEQQPLVSEVESPIDAIKVSLLKNKLVKVLTGSGAYELEVEETPESSVPGLVDSVLSDENSFVWASQAMAVALLHHQTGSSPEGLLTVIDCVVAGLPAVAILKLEREAGAQLTLSEHNGKKTFEMAVLGDLVLTEGTKLFKAALFVRQAGEMIVLACDDQRSFTWTTEMALFWTRFLGCKLREAPRITTRKFFETTVAFINEVITDPATKNDLYDHIISGLKTEKKIFSPKKFIEDYVPKKQQDVFRKFLQSQNIQLTQFSLDISEIKNHLKKRSLETSTGVRVTVPIDSDVVEVTADRVIIDDKVINVGS